MWVLYMPWCDYSTPRGCLLTNIAEEIGRAKSTVSEILHRAEGTIITEYVERERSRWTPPLTVTVQMWPRSHPLAETDP